MSIHREQWEISIGKKGIKGMRLVYLTALNITRRSLEPITFTAKIKSGNTVISRYCGAIGDLDSGEREQIVLNLPLSGTADEWMSSLDGVNVYIGNDVFRFWVDATGTGEIEI